MTNLFFLGNNKAVIAYLDSYFQVQGFGLQNLALEDIENFESNKQATLLLIEPYYCNQWNRYFSTAKIWRRYFIEKNHAVRLLIVGDADCKHECYINIFNLPENFKDYLETKRPITDHPKPTRDAIDRNDPTQLLSQNQITDPWEKGLAIYKTDLLKIILQFFDGHDNEGLRLQFNQLRQTFTSAYNRYKSVGDRTYTSNEAKKEALGECYSEIFEHLIEPYGQKEWQALYERWNRYLPMFQFTPFYTTVNNTNSKIQELNSIMQSFIRNQEKFEIEEFDHQLRIMHNRLKKIEKTLRLS